MWTARLWWVRLNSNTRAVTHNKLALILITITPTIRRTEQWFGTNVGTINENASEQERERKRERVSAIQWKMNSDFNQCLLFIPFQCQQNARNLIMNCQREKKQCTRVLWPRCVACVNFLFSKWFIFPWWFFLLFGPVPSWLHNSLHACEIWAKSILDYGCQVAETSRWNVMNHRHNPFFMIYLYFELNASEKFKHTSSFFKSIFILHSFLLNSNSFFNFSFH